MIPYAPPAPPAPSSHPLRHLLFGATLFVAAYLSAVGAASSVILDFDLSGVPNSPVPAYAPTTTATGVESGGLTRGAGLTATNLTAGFSASNWTPGPLGASGPSRANAIAGDKYLGFDLVVAGGYLASLDSLDFALRRSAVNAPLYFELQYSLDGFASPGVKIADFTFRARVSGSNPTLATNPEQYFRFGAPEVDGEAGFELPPDPGAQLDTTTTPGRPIAPIDLSAFTALQNLSGGTVVSFRLYGWGNGSTATSNTVAFGRIHGPRITGTVIVDPATLDRVAVDVRTPVASTQPEAGVYLVPPGAMFEASAAIRDLGASRDVPTGWTGSGSITPGIGSTASFTITEPSVLTWQWKRENRLTLQAEGAGVVRVRTTDRFPVVGFDFTGWRFATPETLPEGSTSNAEGVLATYAAPGFTLPALVRGPGLLPADLAAGGLSSQSWNNTPALADALATDKYLEFSLTAPGATPTIDLDSLEIPYRYTQTGPHSIALYYSFDGFTTSTLVEAVRIQDQVSGTQLSGRLFHLPADPRLRPLSGPVTFRLYGWGGTGTGVGTFAPYNQNGPGRLDLILYGGVRSTTDVNDYAQLWREENALIAMEALPAPGHVFLGWSGPRFHDANVLSGLSMTAPFTLSARFAAASLGDGVPDAWRQAYYGATPAAADSDTDGDGFTLADEYRRGTDPTVPQGLTSGDHLPLSSWTNPQLDPELPGRWMIRDFDRGFRGLWDGSNHGRSALNPFRPDGQLVPSVDHTSHDGPRLVVRDEIWSTDWAQATLSTVISVGDNDGVNVYFRYTDELNWYRVTLCGEDGATSRPRLGVSVEKRVAGEYRRIAFDNTIALDPADAGFFKRLRVVVHQNGADFEVRVEGWDEFLSPPAFNPALGSVLTFRDESHPAGRAGLGVWAMGAHTFENPAWNPVDSGALFENFRLELGGAEVFGDDWAERALSETLPAGWAPAFGGDLAGQWSATAHGTLAQLSAAGAATTGTLLVPRANADGPSLLGPATGSSTYALDVGLQAYGVGGLGFVFDYVDADNYGRVLFTNRFAAQNGTIPSGVTISRKINGSWTDKVIGDDAFVPTLGAPFRASLARSGQDYVLNLQDPARPDIARRWTWNDPFAPLAPARAGFVTWRASDAHLLHLDVYAAVSADPALAITNITLVAGEIVLTVHNPSGQPYDVQRSTDLAAGDWTVVAPDQTGAEWRTPLPANLDRVFWRLAR